MISFRRMLIFFRHWNKEIEAKVDRVHEATLFIFSKHADRAIEDPTRPIEEETALARIRVNALIRRAVLYTSSSAKTCSPYLESFLWAETHQSAFSAYHSALTLANSLALSQDSFIILLIWFILLSFKYISFKNRLFCHPDWRVGPEKLVVWGVFILGLGVSKFTRYLEYSIKLICTRN